MNELIFSALRESFPLGLLLKATVVLGMAGVVALALHRASAATRHLVWEVGVAGLVTLPLLAALLPSWEVAVETAASGVYVSGEVMKPGKVPLDRPMTAFEAIMEAGGFSKFANPKQVVVVRNQGGKHQRYALNLSDTLSGASDSAFYFRPYDTIYVSQSRW